MQDISPYRFEILVIDAGSDDGSIDIVEKLQSQYRVPVIRQIVAHGCTEAEGQIIGINNARNEIIMFTNSDIYVPRDWMTRHLAWLEKGYDLVGGKAFWAGDKYTFTWNMPSPNRPQFIQQPGLGLGFSNCSIRKEYLIGVGGLMDLPSQHDTELAFRIIQNGGKMILDPKLQVLHDHPFKSFRGSFLRAIGYSRNHVLVMRASLGTIVTGSGSAAMMPLGTIIKEWTGLNAVKTYEECYWQARKSNIRISLLEFVFIRLFSTKLGQILGIFLGAVKPRVSLTKLPDLHKQIEKIGAPAVRN